MVILLRHGNSNYLKSLVTQDIVALCTVWEQLKEN